MVAQAAEDCCREDGLFTRWPSLAGRMVRVGGVMASCGEVAAARDALAAAGGIMVRQVLRAAGSPLAGCDYHAVARPFLPARRRLQAGGQRSYGRGAAGRPVTRTAFIRALGEVLSRAEAGEPARVFAAELAAARAAFSADAGYAAAMAAAAVAARERAHAAWLRAVADEAAREAVAACAARAGEFRCAAVSACGTGDCRLAGEGRHGWLVAGLAGARGEPVPAGPGRLARPANHADAGCGFGTGAAAAALARLVPFTVPQSMGTAAARVA